MLPRVFKRPDSQYWRIRLQFNGKAKEISLRTTDKAEAERLALPHIYEHKAKLEAARPKLETGTYHPWGLGESVQPDGSRVIATPDTAIFLDADGKFLRQESNREATMTLRTSAPLSWKNFDREVDRPKLATKNTDDDLFEEYVKFGPCVKRGRKARGAKLDPHSEAEARKMWSLFRTLVNKPLAQTTRDDARKIIAHLEASGLKSATIRRKFVYLVATVERAIVEGKLTFNPFAKLASVGDDVLRRIPLSDEDMALCWANLDKLSASDQLAFRLLAASGMRLGEVFEIGTVIEKVIKRKGQPDKTIRYVNGTEVEKGVRYCVAGTKTKNSTRRVPFPASVLPYLPAQITGPVLEGDSDGTSSRLNAWLRDIGIDDPAKVVYSLRHRAKDQLRAEECDEKIAEAIFGRDKVTMGDKYGVGYPMTVLKKWIDKIDPHQPGLRAVA